VILGPIRGVLDREAQARRIEAARVLRGLSRNDLSEMFVEEGFGKIDIARLERADPDLRLTRPRWETLARLLDVPEHWFTADDAELFDRPSSQMDRIEARLAHIDRSISALLAAAPPPAPADELVQPPEADSPSARKGRDADSDPPADAQRGSGG
jgi:hypothetical protein